MVSVLHSAFFLRTHDGINRQMEAEQAAAEGADLEWRCAVFTVSPHQHRLSVNKHRIYMNRFVGRLAYYRWLLQAVRNYDVLMLRYSLSDPLQPLFIWLVKKPVYLVHHTLEVPQVAMYMGPFTAIRVWVEKIFGKLSLSQVAGLICVTNEIANYEASRVARNFSAVHIYPNGLRFLDDSGIATTEFVNKSHKDGLPDHKSEVVSVSNQIVQLDEQRLLVRESHPVQMLFVASLFIEWHGLDKVIDAAIASDKDFVVHVVGEVGDSVLEAKAKACANIVLHGKLPHSQITALEQKCHIGLGSFALERKGMVEACPLKVRGYLAGGLPVYAGHPDVFPENFPFYTHGPCDFNNICEYASSVVRFTKQQVSQESRQFIDKDQLLSDLYKFIESSASVKTMTALNAS